MKEKKLIGLTGKYCAGKNYVAKILEELGLPVIDVDVLGHKVIEIERDKILARFGRDILGKDGLIDRKLLGAKVFNSPEALSALEGIVHPGANRETMAWIEGRTEKACVINAALLHRSTVFEKLDGIILVEAALLTRILRARRRDRLPWTAIFKRIRKQIKFNSQYFRKKTDIYRVKNGGFFKLENRIDEILSLLGIERG